MIRCPKCGFENSDEAMNYNNCRINLEFGDTLGTLLSSVHYLLSPCRGFFPALSIAFVTAEVPTPRWRAISAAVRPRSRGHLKAIASRTAVTLCRFIPDSSSATLTWRR